MRNQPSLDFRHWYRAWWDGREQPIIAYDFGNDQLLVFGALPGSTVKRLTYQEFRSLLDESKGHPALEDEAVGKWLVAQTLLKESGYATKEH